MEPSEARSGALRVVVTEDSRTIRGFICRQVRACLPEAGLVECCHGGEALGHLIEAAAHLVITDLQMPGLGGEDFLRRAHREGLLSEAGVIVISSSITPRVREALGVLPAVRFLRKPATADEIVRTLKDLLARPAASRA